MTKTEAKLLDQLQKTRAELSTLRGVFEEVSQVHKRLCEIYNKGVYLHSKEILREISTALYGDIAGDAKLLLCGFTLKFDGLRRGRCFTAIGPRGTLGDFETLEDATAAIATEFQNRLGASK